MNEHTDKMAARVLGAVQDYVRRNLAPWVERLKGVEQRTAFIPVGATLESLRGAKGEDGKQGDRGEKGTDGRDADQELIARLVKEAVDAIPRPRDGKDYDPDILQRAVDERVQAAIAALPTPKDGADGKDADPAVVREMVRAAVVEIPPPRDGRDADPKEIERVVQAAVGALPPARDGKDADPEVVKALVADAVAKLPPPTAGKDGQDGQDGRDAIELDVLERIQPTKRYQRGTYAYARGGTWKAVRPTDPLPEDGDPFAAGWTCVWRGLAEMAVEKREDLRTIAVGWAMTDGKSGDMTATLPVVIDRGVFDPERRGYDAGDGVTWDGSFWIAQRAVAAGERPGDKSEAFRLAVKKGRDGRDGLKGEKGERGAAGRDGKDLRLFGQ